MGLLEFFDDRTLGIALAPLGVVWFVALAWRGRPRLWPYLVWAFGAGVWGVWWIVEPSMLLAFGAGVLVGWATVGRVRRRALQVRRGLAEVLLRWANRVHPDRPWGNASGG